MTNDNLMAIFKSRASVVQHLMGTIDSPSRINGNEETVQRLKKDVEVGQPNTRELRRSMELEGRDNANKVRPNIVSMEKGPSDDNPLVPCDEGQNVSRPPFGMQASKGPKWKKRAWSGFVPLGMTVKGIEELN